MNLYVALEISRCSEGEVLMSCRFLFLFLENFGVRKLEALFCTFIAIMALSFAWMFGQTNPDVKAMVKGLFPCCLLEFSFSFFHLLQLVS